MTGKLENGQIIIDAGADDDVRILLNGVDIHCETSAAIDCEQAGALTLMLLSHTENFLSDGEDDGTGAEAGRVNAVINSEVDLFIGGEGSLEITAAYQDAINAKKNLQINSGTMTLSAIDDGIHADETLSISEGTIHVINACEGLEAQVITINGGTIDMTSSDDGINANGENGQIYLNGGRITVNAEGDGLDANGSIEMTDGYVLVYGPVNDGDSALDFDQSFHLSGGTLICLGSKGMLQYPQDVEDQCVLVSTFAKKEAGTEWSLTDDSGNTIASGTALKSFESMIISTPDMVTGLSGQLVLGTESTDVTLSDTVTTVFENGESPGMMPGGPGGMKREEGGQRMQAPEGGPGEGMQPPEGENGEVPERPEGMQPPEGNDGEPVPKEG